MLRSKFCRSVPQRTDRAPMTGQAAYTFLTSVQNKARLLQFKKPGFVLWFYEL